MDKIKRLILEQAVEDYTGLWELVPEIDGVVSGASANDLRKLAEDAVLSLLEDGLIGLYRGTRFNGDETEIGPSERDRLKEPSEWSPPAGLIPHLRIGARSAGEEAYYAGKFATPT